MKLNIVLGNLKALKTVHLFIINMYFFSQKDKKQEGLNKQTQETRFLFKCYCSNKLSVLSRVFVVALLLKLLYRVGFLCLESLSAFLNELLAFLVDVWISQYCQSEIPLT